MSDKESDKHSLLPRHRDFVNEYFLNGNKPYEAYRKVYPNASEASARTKSSLLLKLVKASSYFESLEAEQAQREVELRKKAEEKLDITREWLLEANKKVYESAMKGDEIITEKSTYTKLDRSAACKALDQLAKMIGGYIKDKADFNPLETQLVYVRLD